MQLSKVCIRMSILLGIILTPLQTRAIGPDCTLSNTPFTTCLRELAGDKNFDVPKAASESEEAVKAAVRSTIRRVVAILTSLIALLALAALIVGAIMYITSLGNDSRVALAKRIIFWALLGIIVAIFSALLVNITISLLSGGGLVDVQ